MLRTLFGPSWPRGVSRPFDVETPTLLDRPRLELCSELDAASDALLRELRPRAEVKT